MSGIAGIVRFDGGPVDRALLEKMADFQAFRGPHGRGVWCEGSVGFVHTLFKLNDDDAPAPQPLSLDGKVWITAHARIDAQDELIAALRGRGRDVARGLSDAGLLLHAYHAWGERCLEHVIGDFTFAIWDARERRLFCAVDHFGIRPFYYARIGTAVVFSNTLNCVRLHPAVSETLDDTAVGDFLLFGQYVDADRTIYADIKRIPRAHCMNAAQPGITIRRYWEMAEDEEIGDYDPGALVEEFRSRLLSATRDRLRTRRAAVFMSGGLDSTLVTAMAVSTLREQRQPSSITPFTIVFRELIPDDEGTYAHAAARHLGLQLRLQVGDAFSPFDWPDRRMRSPPQPPADPAWGIHVERMREVAEIAPLALTGWEGDDPLRAWLPGHWRRLVRAGRFGQLVHDMGVYAQVAKGPPPIGARTALLRLRRRLSSDPLPDWLDPNFVRRGNLAQRHKEQRDVLARTFRAGSRAAYMEKVSWAGIFDGYDPDWTGTALEVAHPIMDVRFVSWLVRVPAVPWCIDKRMSREAASGILPETIVRRPKAPLRGDPGEEAFQRTRRQVSPLTPQVRAKAMGYIAFERLLEPSGEIRSDHRLETCGTAISLLSWLQGKGEDPSSTSTLTANSSAPNRGASADTLLES